MEREAWVFSTISVILPPLTMLTVGRGSKTTGLPALDGWLGTRELGLKPPAAAGQWDAPRKREERR
jgi:hypothetical protein